MTNEESMMRVCPKCGRVGSSLAATKCSFCHCLTCDTGVTEDDYLDWEDEEQERWKIQMVAKYAPNVSEETKQKRAEYDNTPPIFVPKCPTCGHYARPTTNLEASYGMAIGTGAFHNKTAGKSFICDHCGYTW